MQPAMEDTSLGSKWKSSNVYITAIGSDKHMAQSVLTERINIALLLDFNPLDRLVITLVNASQVVR